ncbi:glycoside hydrolase family 97 catalytic domain-containing protein [Halorubellus litoreus]|uniref:Glycoside hydrolase family 97 catalytic domain-containing protein n=1 Tax=Halorubellus litoreus TaxID=755308 RepID=A0ABD5VMU2_9EURY
MTEDNSRASKNLHSRRGLLGGLTGLIAASAYSATVPTDATAQVTSGDASDVQTVTSPDGRVEVTVDVSTGVPTYSISYDDTTHVDASPIGFNFANQATFGTGIAGSGPDVTVTGSESGTATETWEPEWGNYDVVSEDYAYRTIGLAETSAPSRSANLQVRAFDDGVGFRVAFDDDFGEFTITSENTEVNVAGDYTSWWIANEFVNPRFEQEYRETALSDVPAGSKTIRPNDNTVRKGVHTPLTMRADDGTYLSVHESNLDDYATMSLAAKNDAGGNELAVELAPLPDGTKVQASAPHVTPWRTFQVGDRPGDLVESELVPLLADARDDSVLPGDGSGGVDTDWITGKSYVGIWWTMIAGSANWEYKSDSEIESNGNDPASYVHGARTERMQRYMRFASEHGIDSVLVEGWNEGWDTYPGDGTGLEMGVADSYPDFDVPTVTDYGANLPTPVEMTIHNETAGNIVNYEDEIENAGVFDEYEAEGVRSIKNGYVSDPGLGFEGDGSYATHNQHCQTAVNHHRLAIRRAAANRQLLEIHEGIKPTGEIRTYPNVAAREVVKAQEYDGFGELGADVGRDHHVLLPFTRMLAGPTSYQPGIFDVTFNDDDSGRIQTTRAKQLAMYPTYLGGIQMAADRIEAYVDPTLEVGEFVQAQSGELDGMITADEWRNAYGAHYVPVDPNREPDGATASFTVKNVESAGTYDIHLRYASDAEENAQAVVDNGGPEATLVVNGSERTIQPAYTDYWDDWAVHTEPVELQAGENTVTVKLGADDVGGFNLNTIAVSEQGGSSPVAAEYGNVDPAKENHDTVPEFDFIENLPVADWDETRVLDSSIGEYVVTAKRSGSEWFLGAMTNGTARDVTVNLDFLSAQADGWAVTEYVDAEGTGVESNPTEVAISDYRVEAGDSRTLSLGASGGAAMRLRPADSSGVTIASFDDVAGDDDGPGAYTYPTDASFQDGAFDLRGFEVSETASTYDFTFEVANLYDAYDSGNFSPHFLAVWLRDPAASGGRTTELGDLSVTAQFVAAWQYRIAASGYDQHVTDASGNEVGAPTLVVDRAANTATVSVDKATLSDVDVPNGEVVPVVGSEDYGAFRNVQENATQWQFGGAKSGAADDAPRVVDLVTPTGTTQRDALAYDAGSLATLPFRSL